jgi:hypothetical protein
LRSAQPGFLAARRMTSDISYGSHCSHSFNY